MASKKLPKCSLPTHPRAVALGGLACSCITASSQGTDSGARSKSERCVMLSGICEQTAFALAVLVRPANCRTNVPSGRSLPPALEWAMWLKTSTFRDSVLYQCGLVGSDGTYFLIPSWVDL